MERSEKDWLTTLLLSIMLFLFRCFPAFDSIAKESPSCTSCGGGICVFTI